MRLRRSIAPCRALTFALPLAAALPAAAQDVEEALRDAARQTAEQSDFADQLVGLTGFATLPGIASATFWLDDEADSEIRRINLPLARRFESLDALGGKAYAELTLGYMDLAQDFKLDAGGPLETRVDSDLVSFSAIAGAGIGYALGETTTLTPILLAGYTRIEDDADLKGPGAALIDVTTDGILLNFDVEEFVYGAALKLEERRSLQGDVNLAADLRYNYLWGRTLSASDDVLEDETDFGVLTAAATLDGPTGARAFDRDLRWIGFATGTYLPGLASRALDFDYFVELGGGLEIVDRDVVRGVEGASIRASYIVGNDVTGYSVGLTLEF